MQFIGNHARHCTPIGLIAITNMRVDVGAKIELSEQNRVQIKHFIHVVSSKGAVTLSNFSCNLSHNFVATQVARILA